MLGVDLIFKIIKSTPNIEEPVLHYLRRVLFVIYRDINNVIVLL